MSLAKHHGHVFKVNTGPKSAVSSICCSNTSDSMKKEDRCPRFLPLWPVSEAVHEWYQLPSNMNAL